MGIKNVLSAGLFRFVESKLSVEIIISRGLFRAVVDFSDWLQTAMHSD